MRDTREEGSEQTKRTAKRQPFGDPDGSRADIEHIVRNFINMDQRHFASGITSSEFDRNIRVIIGKKGSGKTVYLRRLQDSARKEESVFASKITQDVPSTHAVTAFCQMFNHEQLTEAWQSAWRIALIRAAISHILCKKFFSPYIDRDKLENELSKFACIQDKWVVERSPYTEIKNIISTFKNDQKFWQYMQDDEWDEVQTILGTALKNCPPIFFYLDAIDDEFAHAPMEWHRCQKGLFYAVMRFLRQPGAIGSRLHVVIAIRDIVYSSVLRSESRTRYVGSPNICLLDWNISAIKHFLNRKIQMLDDEHFVSCDKKTIESFVGIDSVKNSARKKVERIADYIIRHTRGLPRDIIQIGNAIAAAKVDDALIFSDHKQWSARIKSIISVNANMFADEQLEICANQLSSHDAPSRSAQHGYSDYYTSNKEYVDQKKSLLKSYISAIGKESFSYNEIKTADDVFEHLLPDNVRISTILWQNGLIGTKRTLGENRWEFYSLGKSAEFIVPDNSTTYGFHSILLDAIPTLALREKLPIFDSM